MTVMVGVTLSVRLGWTGFYYLRPGPDSAAVRTAWLVTALMGRYDNDCTMRNPFGSTDAMYRVYRARTSFAAIKWMYENLFHVHFSKPWGDPPLPTDVQDPPFVLCGYDTITRAEQGGAYMWLVIIMEACSSNQPQDKAVFILVADMYTAAPVAH